MTDHALRSSAEAGRVAIETLVEHGRRLGLAVATEFAVPGARIDVVWLWRPPIPIPGVSDPLPLVGFEVESSWRTRKHIKGDMVNLQDLACALGVIVLLGSGDDVESTRRFASQRVDRPGCRIIVWSEADLAELGAGQSNVSDLLAEVQLPQVPSQPTTPQPVRMHTGKYQPLWQWLTERVTSPVTLSFDEVEVLLGFPLPPSSRRHLPHWYGYDNTAVGRAIRDAGWRARGVSLQDETVTFERSGLTDTAEENSL